MSHSESSQVTASAGRVYGGLSPEERLEQRRERLMEVGLDLFASRGFARTGVRELCRAAKIGERAFYEAVGSREALLRDVYLQVTDDVVGDIARGILAGPTDLRGRLHAGLVAFFTSITDDPRRGRVIYVESLGRGPEIEEARREGLSRFVALTQMGMRGYLPVPAPPTFAVKAAVSSAIIGIGEIAYQLAEGEDAFTAAEAAEVMTTGLLGAALALGLRDPAADG